MGQSSAWRAPPNWQALREETFRRYGHVCWKCGRFAGSVDHVIARALGGSHDPSNLRPACSSCNSSAGASLGNRMYGPRGNRRPGRRAPLPAMPTSRRW